MFARVRKNLKSRSQGRAFLEMSKCPFRKDKMSGASTEQEWNIEGQAYEQCDVR